MSHRYGTVCHLDIHGTSYEQKVTRPLATSWDESGFLKRAPTFYTKIQNPPLHIEFTPTIFWKTNFCSTTRLTTESNPILTFCGLGTLSPWQYQKNLEMSVLLDRETDKKDMTIPQEGTPQKKVHIDVAPLED
jgi:hypothetical protein